ncbi:MAG: hypothetical protein K5648_02080 [Erysipelotrichaceae bacterium]|nr:hypothetical protein [Erysipelotrichaceae bacterium]
MKKLLIVLILLISLSGCSSKKETDLTNDNYRVFYEIFVGSFSDSNGDGIGDLRGIIDRLDYLNDGNVLSKDSLGIQGIWLTPIFYSPSYHKYDVIDYYRIDPSFGTQDDLDELISECHKRNVLVILDIAFNHTSSQNEWFRSFVEAHQNNDYNNKYYDFYTYAYKNDSPSGRSFCDISWTDQNYECNFSYDMPELNFDNPEVRNEVLNIARFYLNKGVDGFRFDAAKYLYLTDRNSTENFWKWYTEELKKIKEDIYLVGEVWSSEAEVNGFIDELNCFNFSMPQNDGMIANCVKSSDIGRYTAYIENYQSTLRSIDEKAMPIPFLSNHDMDRSAGYLNVSNGEAYLASDLYLLSPGSPFIYYGEEIGMKGSRGGANTDANRRLRMLWGDQDTVSDPEGSTYELKNQVNGTVSEQLKNEKSLLKNYQKLIYLRKKYPGIARGTYEKISFDQPSLGGFKVSYQDKTLYVIHNCSNEEIKINTDLFTKLLDHAGFADSSFKNNEFTVGPYSSAILE